MNNFDQKTARFIIIICTILLIFVLVVNHAYKYLPQNDTIPKIHSVEDINSQRDFEEENTSETIEKSPTEENSNLKNTPKNDSIEFATHKEREMLELIEQKKAELERIPTPEENKILETSSSSFKSTFDKAKKAFSQKEYNTAIELYKSAITLTSEKNLLALCYDDLAKIYAHQKKFGSAISFAQKAYNSDQTSEREFFLARLNYKVGNTQRADELIKRSLQRDFNF